VDKMKKINERVNMSGRHGNRKRLRLASVIGRGDMHALSSSSGKSLQYRVKVSVETLINVTRCGDVSLSLSLSLSLCLFYFFTKRAAENRPPRVLYLKPIYPLPAFPDLVSSDFYNVVYIVCRHKGRT